jgi:hypothetical protein
MQKTAWRLYVAQAYALGFSALMLGLPAGLGAWFANLPWMYWGTDLLEAAVYWQTPQPGSIWLAFFVVHLVVGFLWLLSWTIFEVMALIYNAAVRRVESERQVVEAPRVSASTNEPTTGTDSIESLVQDPEIQKLMHDLERRLRA